MKYSDGYPEPYVENTATINDVEFGPGDQFRFPISDHPITGEERFGLCYVLNIDYDPLKVVFFNVTEEARTTHTRDELQEVLERGSLTKLDEKWSE